MNEAEYLMKNFGDRGGCYPLLQVEHRLGFAGEHLTELYIHYISSRIFESAPQKGPEYSYRNLAIARFMVTA